ncbi:hypothetical protein FRB98_004244 [Tulasnella sp. 332]|nr:hypothetical protein FRB98_004244 [Tulasnella sp. 332]
MSRSPAPPRRGSLPGIARAPTIATGTSLRAIPASLQPKPESSGLTPRLASLSGAPPSSSTPSNAKPTKAAQRTTKVSQKLVVLPSEPQTAPFPVDLAEDSVPSNEHPPPPKHVQEHYERRSEGERMTKSERQRAGYRRLTAYSVGEGFRTKLLLAFLKREHAVVARVFDEAIYAVYHLPLLPGYAANVNIRSSPAPTSSIFTQMSEAEELGYQETYFAPSSEPERFSLTDGYISASPPVNRGQHSDTEHEHNPMTPHMLDEPLRAPPPTESPPKQPRISPKKSFSKPKEEADRIAEMIVFDYGVVVFFGFDESQERNVLEDLDRAMICVRPRQEDKWEIEYDPTAPSPRIYNDFFTFKSHTHLLKLSISHALAQSVLLAHYETMTHITLSNSQATEIPKKLAETGSLKGLGRKDALKLTGKLFKLRRDVNLSSNVLDTPELFWSEASLQGLYGAVREYWEIDERVGVLNQKLAVTSELLDIIHDHLNNGAMIRITWIIIWLIVVACLVELGEVLARLVVQSVNGPEAMATVLRQKIGREEAMLAIERLMNSPPANYYSPQLPPPIYYPPGPGTTQSSLTRQNFDADPARYPSQPATSAPLDAWNPGHTANLDDEDDEGGKERLGMCGSGVNHSSVFGICAW